MPMLDDDVRITFADSSKLQKLQGISLKRN